MGTHLRELLEPAWNDEHVGRAARLAWIRAAVEGDLAMSFVAGILVFVCFRRETE